MKKEEFKTVIENHEDLLNELAYGIEYHEGTCEDSVSTANEKIYVTLYGQDMYGWTNAEWGDDGVVRIYIYEGKVNYFVEEGLFTNAEEFNQYMNTQFVIDNKYEISAELLAKYGITK